MMHLDQQNTMTSSESPDYKILGYCAVNILHWLDSGRLEHDLGFTLLSKTVEQKAGKPKYCPCTWACPRSCLGVPEWAHQGRKVGKPSMWVERGIVLAVPAMFCVDKTWANSRRYLALCFMRQQWAGACRSCTCKRFGYALAEPDGCPAHVGIRVIEQRVRQRGEKRQFLLSMLRLF